MLPTDVCELITSFMFQCRLCSRYHEHPQYLVCTRCVIVWKNVCKNCYMESSKACHCVHNLYPVISKQHLVRWASYPRLL